MADQEQEQSPPLNEGEAKESGGMAVATPKRKPTSSRRKPGQLPQYKVLLHNDDENDFGHVIRSIVHLTPLQKEEAIQRTIEAHKSGVSLLLVTHKERAELYQEQFTSLSLTVTIEADA